MIRIAIVDDEMIILNYYRELLAAYKEESGREKELYIKYYLTGEDLLEDTEYVRSLDILFIDCYMGEGKQDGITCAERVRMDNEDVKIIFVTSTDEFALKAYRVRAHNYIMKSNITRENFIKELDAVIRSFKSYNGHFVCKYNGGIEIIDSRDIIYVERVNRKIVICTSTGERECCDTLASVAEQLDERIFVKVNRSSFVNVRYVKMVCGDKIILKNDMEIYMSSKHYRETKNEIAEKLICRR